MHHALALLAFCLLTVSSAMADLATIEGTAAYRERMALPEGAVLDIELLDISRADASAERLASIRIAPRGQVPIPFTLHYDPALIDERFTYAVTATLRHDGRMLFRSDTIHPVLTWGAGDSADIMMVRVATDSDEPPAAALLGPAWVAEDIDGRGVIDDLQSWLTFTDEGRIQGHGGCNGFSGGYTLAGDALTIGGEGARIVATLMACPPAILDQEAKFFAALERVRHWRIDNGLLFLLDAENTPIIRLWQREP